jgi:protein phosphatase 1 regulatory subunit 3A/B/C/D/E
MLQVQSHSTDRLLVTPAITMPVDFAAYLLSASPPGFEMYNASMVRDHLMATSGSNRHRSNSCEYTRPPRPIINVKSFSDSSLSNLSGSSSSQDDSGTESSSDGSPLASPTESKCKSDLHCNGKKKGLRKKVSFADDLGLALAKIKILTESPDTPPLLRREMLDSLTQGASACVVEDPPLVLNFTQPASDYLPFREKIEKSCVSLENVILKDYNLMGTIKVKNIGFEKVVKVRVSYDSWESHFDVMSTYVPNTYSAGHCSPYDTFSFEFSIPTDLDKKQTVQFAVCFEVNGKQYWDSNDGQNYEVVSKDWKKEPAHEESQESSSNQPHIFRLGFSPDWTQYSSWTHSDNEVPYW